MIVLTIAGAVAYFLSGAPTQDVPSGLSTIPKEAVKEKPSKSAQSALTYHADGPITLDVRKARLELDARLIEHIPQSQIIAEVERLKAKYKGVERSKQLYVYFKKIIENKMPFDQLSGQVEYFASELGDNEWVNLTNHIAARFPGDFTKAELMFENRPFSSTYASILNAWLTGTASSYPGQSLKFIRSLPPDWQQSAQVSLVSSLASSGIEHALADVTAKNPRPSHFQHREKQPRRITEKRPHVEAEGELDLLPCVRQDVVRQGSLTVALIHRVEVAGELHFTEGEWFDSQLLFYEFPVQQRIPARLIAEPGMPHWITFVDFLPLPHHFMEPAAAHRNRATVSSIPLRGLLQFLLGEKGIEAASVSGSFPLRLVADVPVPLQQMINIPQRQGIAVEEEDLVILLRVLDQFRHLVFPAPCPLRPGLPAHGWCFQIDFFQPFPLHQKERGRRVAEDEDVSREKSPHEGGSQHLPEKPVTLRARRIESHRVNKVFFRSAA